MAEEHADSESAKQEIADAMALAHISRSLEDPNTPDDARQLLERLAGPIADRLQAGSPSDPESNS